MFTLTTHTDTVPKVAMLTLRAPSYWLLGKK
jgi:hypothetical protein